MLERVMLAVMLVCSLGFPLAVFAQSPSSAPSSAPASGPNVAQPEPVRPLAIPVHVPNLPLGLVTFPNGKAMNLTVGIGSAAYRQPGDAQGRLWLMTDRGPNIDCQDAKRLLGLELEQACSGDKAGRIYPLAGFVPSIYGVDIGADQAARIAVYLPLKGKSGKPLSGRPVPSVAAKEEPPYGLDGKALPADPSGVDPEALVRLSDGTFWIAEEYGPSLLHVAEDGTVLRRLVPALSGADFKDADYEVLPVLPALMRARPTNRGFEGLALSPDERFLFVAMQAPLYHPDRETGRGSRNVRFLKIARDTGLVVGQFLYQLDEASAFTADTEGRERRPHHVGISEIVALGDDRLLVQERIDRTSRLFIVDLGEAQRLPDALLQEQTQPGLEALDGEALAQAGVRPPEKRLVLDTDQVPGLPGKIEGVAVLGPGELLVVNDNDFAIDGVRTQMFRIMLPLPLLTSPQNTPQPLPK